VSGDFLLSGGTLSLQNGNNTKDTLKIGGDFSQSGGTITQTGNSSYGTIIFNGSTPQTITKSAGIISNAIYFNVDSLAVVSIMGPADLSGSTGTFVVDNGGKLRGTGELTVPAGNNSTLTVNGSIAPGNSIGTLTINGNVAISGSYDVEIDGTPLCDQIIVIGGTATLGGTLNVTYSGTIQAGYTYTIIAGTLSGDFGAKNLPGGLSAWTIDNTSPDYILTYTGSALPVTWLTFRAALNDNNGVDLFWSTGAESNNEGFDVERSNDGRDWQTIDFVPGAGTTSEVSNYQYTDPLISHPSSLIYYRLKQRDFDGSIDYSPVRTVELSAQNGIRVYPNPANEEVTVSFAQPTEVRGTLRLYTQNNRLVAEYVIPPQTTDYPVRVAGLPPGTYLLQVVTGSQVWNRRVVVE